jgi:large subunit ribosomal protein L6
MVMSTETIAIKQSRVGKIGVPVPKGVTVTIQGGKMNVKGPKGDLTRPLPPNVDVKIDDGVIKVMPTIAGRDGARFQGLTRALLNIMVKGVSESFVRVLELKGTGYRAEMKGQVLNLALGFSHPINFPVPQGIVQRNARDSHWRR